MKKLITILLAVVLVFTLVSCGGKTDDNDDADKRTKVSVGLANKVESCNPYNGANQYKTIVLNTIFQSLGSRVTADSEEIQGIMMKTYEQLDDYSYRVTLYDYIKDSAGNPFTTSDVVFCVDLGKSMSSSVARKVEKIDVEDASTFVITFNTAELGTFLNFCESFNMMTEAAYKASPDEMSTTPVGTGPYVAAEVNVGSNILVEKNENYWQTAELNHPIMAQNIDVIDFVFLQEATQMSIALEQGTVQMGEWVDISLYDQVKAMDNLNVQVYPSSMGSWIAVDMREGSIFHDNIELRRAIWYAIDEEEINIFLTNGEGTIPKAMGNSGLIGYNPKWEERDYFSYDPEKAAQCLEAAGYAPGELTLTYLVNNTQENKTISELIQSQLGRIGIKVELETYDNTTYQQYQNANQGKYDICTFGSGMGSYWSKWAGYTLGQSYGTDGCNLWGLHDDTLQGLLDTMNTPGNYTQENIDAVFDYVYENALGYQYLQKINIAALDRNIVAVRQPAQGVVMPNACTYENWTVFAD